MTDTICPLLNAGVIASAAVSPHVVKCAGVACGWWMSRGDAHSRCAILTIAIALERIAVAARTAGGRQN